MTKKWKCVLPIPTTVGEAWRLNLNSTLTKHVFNLCIKEKRIDILRYFCSRNIKLNYSRGYALTAAMIHYDEEIFQLLIDYNVFKLGPAREPALIAVVHRDDLKTLRLLINNGAKLTEKIIRLVCNLGFIDIIRYFIEELGILPKHPMSNIEK